jgi:drug/metabolite transporter (DMT)-like permease
MTLLDLAGLLALAALWGASFLFIRVAAPALGPLSLMGTRTILASLLLLACAAAARALPSLRARWRQFLVLGAVHAALPYTLIAFAELRLTASLTAILLATTPLFSGIVSMVWLHDRLTMARLIGLVLGLSGVAVLVGWSPLTLDRFVALSIGAALLAALCYAVGTVYAKRVFTGQPPLALTVGQNLGASLVLVPFMFAALPNRPPSGAAVGATLALTVLCTAVAYQLFFWLLARIGPTGTNSVTFLIPVFGVAWGVAFLDESVTRGTIAGLMIVLASTALVTGFRPAHLRATSRAGTRKPTRPAELARVK